MNTFTPTSRYRSNLATLQDHAQIKGGKRSTWTLRDILRAKKEQSLRTQITDVFRARADRRAGTDGKKQKVTVVKRLASIQGFHATGIGNIQKTTFGEVKAKARTHGYTHVRFGGNLISLS